VNARGFAQPDISTKLIGHWEQLCHKLEALAEEFPAQKFLYRPVDGVRSVAELLRHVAFWNNYVADKARGKQPDDSDNELPKEKFSTKSEILQALKQSASTATAALKANSSMNIDTTELMISFIEHNCEHYGQLVVYARLQGIVPPASRG
jgi:uncharacterized damage-inducible protein DinB